MIVTDVFLLLFIINSQVANKTRIFIIVIYTNRICTQNMQGDVVEKLHIVKCEVYKVIN